jgi:sirohydrochlorin cobaltochelatase
MTPSPRAAAKGIVLFAHGSRDPLWHKPIEAVAAAILAAAPATPVVCAYLELRAPDLAHATRELLAAGVREVSIVPLFLGVGKHARDDLPLLVAALRLEHPHILFHLQAAVGEDPRLVRLLAEMALDGF